MKKKKKTTDNINCIKDLPNTLTNILGLIKKQKRQKLRKNNSYGD